MADDQHAARALLNRRLALVSALSGLNAEQLKLLQASGAAEMDVARLEMEAARSGSDTVVRSLQEARQEIERIRSQQAKCEARIAAVEESVAELDRQLACGQGA